MKPHKYDPDRHHRKSIRLSERDYTATSAYFVTISIAQQLPLLEIAELRKILLETWQALPGRFPGVTLDEFVIMPDHIHFIIWLDSAFENAPTLGVVVGAYKSLTTVAWLHHIQSANLEQPGRFWHRNFYERIVRIPELEATRQYIRNNPMKRQQKEDER
jgi:putative transposase